jgi:hypothetical protein
MGVSFGAQLSTHKGERPLQVWITIFWPHHLNNLAFLQRPTT